MNKYNIRPHGLGIIITELSFVLATGKSSVAVVENLDHICFDFKRIFQIPDSVLTIEIGTHGFADLETDELCTYAPYFHNDAIELFGQQFNTKRKKKRCVALAMHHGTGLGEDLESKGMPYNKFASKSEYEKIFSKLTSSGYDVVTMNLTSTNIEQKIYILNELCEFTIGYEGGLGHLAHVLDIPYFCLPWKLNDMGHDGIQPGLWFESHRFHADKKTWFLQDTDEFLDWDRKKLNEMIDRLYNNEGNNILFDHETIMDPETLQIQCKGRDLTPRILWNEQRAEYTRSFIKQHLPLANMQKYPLKSITYTTQ